MALNYSMAPLTLSESFQKDPTVVCPLKMSSSTQALFQTAQQWRGGKHSYCQLCQLRFSGMLALWWAGPPDPKGVGCLASPPRPHQAGGIHETQHVHSPLLPVWPRTRLRAEVDGGRVRVAQVAVRELGSLKRAGGRKGTSK